MNNVSSRSADLQGLMQIAWQPLGSMADGAPVEEPPMPELPALERSEMADIADMTERANGPADIGRMQSMERQMRAALASGDPQMLITVLASALREGQRNAAAAGARMSDQDKNLAVQEQLEAFQRAEEAQGSTKTWSTVARVAAYVAAGAAIAGGIGLAAFTGGTTAVGGIALGVAIFSAAATIGTMMYEDISHETPPKWIGFALGACSLVAACCSFGLASGSVLAVAGQAMAVAGQAVDLTAQGIDLAGGEAPQELRMFAMVLGLIGVGTAMAGSVGSLARGAQGAAQHAGEAARSLTRPARTVAGYIRLATDLTTGAANSVQGSSGAVRSVITANADAARSDAAEARTEIERMNARIEEEIEAMRSVMTAYDRTVRRAMEVRGTEQTTSRALMRNFARA